jgi:homogentisate 1,2-dioxygenase
VPYYRRLGEIPRKRHSALRDANGALYAEELMGERGFSSDSSLLYHRNPPTAIIAADAVADPQPELSPNRPLLPRHLRTHELDKGGDIVGGRRVLLGNSDVTLSYAVVTESSELYRNAIGDELFFVESGSGVFETSFGPVRAETGDYVLVPTSTTFRFVPDPGGSVGLLVVAARGHISPPARYLSSTGQFLEHSPYCERDLRGPSSLASSNGPDSHGPATVLVRQRGGLTRYTYAHHPFDVVGWDGCLYPYAFSIHDFEPIVKRYHAPPPVHQTFEGPGFVICSFCPRPYDFGEGAIAVPYNHANVDSDEVLFYVAGDFMSRRGSGIGVGSISLHPAGFVHGPQPGSVEAAFGQPGTEELAVMVDTFAPLAIGVAGWQCEDPEYAWTWAGGRAKTE